MEINYFEYENIDIEELRGIVLIMNLKEKTCFFYGENIKLTLQEYNFLLALACCPEQMVEYHVLLGEELNESYENIDFARDDVRARSVPCRSKIMKKLKPVYSQRLVKEIEILNFLLNEVQKMDNPAVDQVKKIKSEIKDTKDKIAKEMKMLIESVPSNAGYNAGYRLNLSNEKILIVR